MGEQTRFPMELISAPLHEVLLGTSEAMREVNDLVQRMAQTRLTVLITGESGTGKDIVARMLHRLSPRAEKPFIKVNCPAIPESIFESELFGYERGAFTGAQTSKPGRVELAHHGTLFLDEITETSFAVQGKLLQMLDGEPILRVGGVKPIPCDVRVVAATNMRIEDAVARERIRQELYFRLTEAHIHLPPLRERPVDIPLLAEHFNFNFRRMFGRSYEPLPEAYVQKMLTLPWPGNVRELAACVRKYVATGNPESLFGEPESRSTTLSSPIVPSSLVPPAPAAVFRVPPKQPAAPESRAASSAQERDVQTPPRRAVPKQEREAPPKLMSLKEARRRAIEQAERELIEKALRLTLWNRRKAAKLLGISYSSILRRIEAYNIGEQEMQGESTE